MSEASGVGVEVGVGVSGTVEVGVGVIDAVAVGVGVPGSKPSVWRKIMNAFRRRGRKKLPME